MLKKVFLIFLLNVFAFSFVVLAIPDFVGYVNDIEGTIQNKDELEAKISAFEKETTIEIAVLTTPDFDDTYIEDYAIKVFEKWGIGKKEKDNGVLIIVSKEKRESRIEVGYGLEGVLTDGLTGRIQDVAMIPSFREENYSEGINNGVDMIIKVLGGEEISGVTDEDLEDEDIGYWALGIMAFGFLFLIANPFLSGLIGAVIGFLVGTLTGGFYTGILGGVAGGVVGFLMGLVARLIPSHIRYGIAHSMISSGRSGGSSFGGFGGGSSGGGGSSRSW